jgi:putative membrane protein
MSNEAQSKPSLSANIPKSGRPDPDVATVLAVERTRVAYDRTMMAWIRTATSLLTFGFGIYKFFQLGAGHDVAVTHRVGPREFGLAMVTIGLISLFLAAFENRANIRGLQPLSHMTYHSKPNVLALLIGMLSVAALIVMLMRA